MAIGEFTIGGWTGDGKQFELSNSEIRMFVDNDDVDETRVAAAAAYVKNLLNIHWDDEVYKRVLREEVMKRWNKNEYNLQGDYESVDEFLSNYGLT